LKLAGLICTGALFFVLAMNAVADPDAIEGMQPVDSGLLKKLLDERGYTPGANFKALVMEIPSDESGNHTYYPMDYQGTSDDRDDWWPASTVKLFAAIAALERLHAMGFTPRAKLTFQYEEKPLTQRVDKIIKRAIVLSRNPEFDRLVEFVGCDWLNRRFLNKRNGLEDTVLLRSYFGRERYPESGRGSNRHSPMILIEQGKRTKTIDERFSTATYDCKNDGNCTTLFELAEAMRRVMMHESLPKKERYRYGAKGRALLREALGSDHKQGGIWTGIKQAYGDRPIKLFHKPGYAAGWFSDNVFVHLEDTNERWIVVMANRSGRESCNEAAIHIGELMASGEISRRRKSMEEAAKKSTPSE